MKIISTAALIPRKEEEREQEYRRSMEQLVEISKELGAELLVIESTGNYIPSFFNEYVPQDHIVYTRTNNLNLRNKGVNEFVSLATGLKIFLDKGIIQPDECVSKITGRYKTHNSDFYKLSRKLIEEDKTHNVVAHHHPDGQIFTGLYSEKALNMLSFCSQVDYNHIERSMINIEREFQHWVNREQEKYHYVDVLGVHGKCALGTSFDW